MGKELETLLKIGMDYGTNDDKQCAVINLYYDGKNHIIYETFDKEAIKALDFILSQAEKDAVELYKYKTLEEDYGCPLEVVIKAVKQGKVWNGYTWFLNMKLTFVNDVLVLSNGVYMVELENYAKDPRKFDSWWLKEDKSE